MLMHFDIIRCMKIILKQFLVIFYLSLISLIFVNTVKADVLEIDGTSIDVNGTITSTQVTDEYIFVGGQFTTVSINKQEPIERKNIVEVEKQTNSISSWNPQPDGPVHDMAIYNNTLIVAGQFTTFDSKAKQYIISIDLNTKEEIDNDIVTDQPVYALFLDEETLYLGGDFTVVNDQPRNYITSYDLASNTVSLWEPTLNGSVYDILIIDNIMYVGGAFTTLNETPHASIVATDILNGEVLSWNPTIDMIVTHLEYKDAQIIATGFKKLNEQVVAKRIALDTITANVISEEEVAIDPIGTMVIETQNQNEEELNSELIVNEQELGFKIPSLGELLTFTIRGFFVIAGLAALFYLLLGAFGWVTSGGEQESIDAARNKIQAAVMGLLIMVAVLSVVWTLEKVIFNSKICLGVSCPITIPTLLESSE